MPASLILHIGRHKTGTSALQRFLFRNRQALEPLGFCYPLAGIQDLGHHLIARHFIPGPEGGDEKAREAQREALAALHEEIGRRDDTVILSSEGFQNVPPSELARAFGTGRCRIVVYVREQVEYLLSSYQQLVHARHHTGSIEEFAAGFRVDYDQYLARWEQAFGADQVVVRPYGRQQLLGGDIVTDFCDVVGLPLLPHLVRPAVDRNPSIGGALLEFKRMVNAAQSAVLTPRPIYRALSTLAAAEPEWQRRPVLPAGQAEQIRAETAGSNAAAFARHAALAGGFGEPAPMPSGTPVDLEAVIAVGERLAEREPATSEVLLRALVPDGPLPGWRTLLPTLPRPASNLYAQARAAAVASGFAARERSTDAALDQSFLQDLYAGLLKREPRDNERAHWLAALAGDLDPRQLPAVLMAAPEFGRTKARRAREADQDAAYVRALFDGLLHREPTEAELVRWCRRLEEGMDPRRLPARLASLPERARLTGRLKVDDEESAAYVAALFPAVLRRPPRETELAHWVGQLRKGLAPRLLPERLAASREFAQAGAARRPPPAADRRHIEAVYAAVLHRAPTEPECERWLAMLAEGLDPRLLPGRLAATGEARRLAARLVPDPQALGETVDALYESVLGRPPRGPERERAVAELARSGSPAALARRLAATRRGPSLYVPPGHTNSPIVDPEALRPRFKALVADRSPAAIGVDMQAMLALWEQLEPGLRATELPATPTAPWRYGGDNPSFGRGDAGVLAALLCHLRPRRWIDLAGGPASACVVDTSRRHGLPLPEMDVVGLDAAALEELLGPEAAAATTRHDGPVQSLDPRRVDRLEAGDMLFVDSSHVMKSGSDVNHVLFELLPRLRPGVLVHFHDIYWPFEYRPKWVLDDNRSWNEAYGLRAFLMYNGAFEIAFFSDLFLRRQRDRVLASYPPLSTHPGSSLWLRRRDARPPRPAPSTTAGSPT